MNSAAQPWTWTVWLALRTTLVIARNNFAQFFVVAFVCNLPLTAVQALHGGVASTLVVAIVSSVFLSVSFTLGTLEAMGDNKPDITKALQQILRPFGLRLMALGLLQTIAIFAAFMLFVAPGFYLLALWMVTMPTLMVERTDLANTFRRSADLARDRRWRVLITFVSCFVFFIAIFSLLLLPVLESIGIAQGSIAYHAITLVTGSLTSMVLYCVPAVLYVFLRHEKDGATAQEIAMTLD